jgi:hypothetical protein
LPVHRPIRKPSLGRRGEGFLSSGPGNGRPQATLSVHQHEEQAINSLIETLAKSPPFQGDLDYHLVRAPMVLVFVLFGVVVCRAPVLGILE